MPSRCVSELLAFVNAIRTGHSPAVTGEEAVASLEIAIRCLEARTAHVGGAAAQGSAARRRLIDFPSVGIEIETNP